MYIDTAKAWYSKHRWGQYQAVSHYYHQVWFNAGQLGTGCGGFKADWLADFEIIPEGKLLDRA